MARRVRDYSYSELLDRALSKLPVRGGPAKAFKVPKAEVMFVGGRTILLNFKQIVEALNREERVLQQYLVKELGAPAFLNESGQLVFQGRFNVYVLNRLIEIFVNKYVICPTCGSKDTKLLKKGKVFILRCEACGAETSLEAF
ncbi:MAG: translation initiation factor IF-2 subunit beta [Thermoprotei archaeon]|nr:MAG: translation initiation factor IF-2 subunit beta [Thermoprotei archaeon]